MVKFFPERDYINRMNPPPTAAEKFLLNFFEKYLGNLNGQFDVFFRARLKEGFADIVIVRKNYGVWIITVANLSDAAIVKAKSSKKLFLETCAALRRRNDFPIQTAVFFPDTTRAQVKNFFGFDSDYATFIYNYVVLLTADTLERDGLLNLPKRNFLIGDLRSEFFTDRIYDEICSAIKPYGLIYSADDLSAEQRKRLEPLLKGGSSNVKFFPALEELPHIRPLPTDGELYLLNFLKDYLGKFDGEFEVFFQAHWDGLKPDVVVMRKNHGILIIEVKDWNLDAYDFDKDETYKTWTLKSNGHRLNSPIEQARFYKDLFYNTYSRTLAENNLRNTKVYSLVQTAVFFYGATKTQVKNIPTDKYTILLTCAELETYGLKNLPQAKYFLYDNESDFFTEEIYNELCRVLKPSEHSLSKIFFPIELSKKQQELIQSSRGYKRQLKGPAGSGKTTVLAFRAVDAFRKTNKPVLILTFNITLCNYIRDCISQALNSVSGIEGRKGYVKQNFFVVSHFHEFIRGYRAKNNFITRFDEDGEDTYDLKDVSNKFRTIYVDETQDFRRSWMETILKLLEPGGELIFFGDKDQDLYLRREIDKVPGVVGRPLELKGTYRLRTKILDLARAFQIKFFNGSKDNEIEPPIEQSLFEEYFDESTTVRYEFFPTLDVKAVVDIFEETLKKYQPPNDDICILSQMIRNVRPIDKALRDKGYKTLTTFEEETLRQNFFAANQHIYESDRKKFQELEDKTFYKIRRAAKFAFWMEGGKIKLSTIQSYKGWGIHTEILIIGNDFSGANDKEKFLNAEMVYTGITRAKKNLVIINIGDTEYDEFFRTSTKH